MSRGPSSRAAVTRAALAVLLAAGSLVAPLARQDAGDPARVAWIPESATASVETLERALSDAVTRGATAVVVALGSLDSRVPRERLDGVFALALSHRLRVYGELHVSRVAPGGLLPAERDHVVYEHPEWLMVPRELAPELINLDVRSPAYLGRLARWTRANAARVDGLYLSPLHVGAAAYLAARVRALVDAYPFDGLHFESLAFPGPEFDYSRLAMEALRAELRPELMPAERARMDAVEAIDPFGYAEAFPAEWRRVRMTRLTGLLARLRTAVRAVRPGTGITAALAGEPSAAGDAHLQDWRTWLDGGFVDAVSRRDGISGVFLSSYESVLAFSSGRRTQDHTASMPGSFAGTP